MTDWTKDIAELEAFFQAVQLPQEPIRLDYYRTITDPQKFLTSHLNIVRGQVRNERYHPYLERLQELRSILNAGSVKMDK